MGEGRGVGSWWQLAQHAARTRSPPFLQMEEAIDGCDALAGELTERRTDSGGERGPPNLNGMI